MNRYIIETPHTAEECLRLLDEILAMGYLHNFDWGCMAGDHTGWATIEARDDQEAALAVPPMVRSKARVVQLNKFSEEDVAGFHSAG